MRVGAYKGYVISVFIRDEHCPPHVHVRGKGWDARFRFSFLDGEVELWDVEPERRRPPIALLKEIRGAIMQRHYFGAGTQDLVGKTADGLPGESFLELGRWRVGPGVGHSTRCLRHRERQARRRSATDNFESGKSARLRGD